MKLDRPGALHEEPLAPSDWNMDMSREGNQYIAVVKRQQDVMCRVSIASEGLEEDAARTALAEKARRWIHEYLSRPSPGFMDPK